MDSWDGVFENPIRVDPFDFQSAFQPKKRLIVAYEGAHIKSVPYWREHANEFDGDLIFRIRSLSWEMRHIDVLVHTLVNEKDVALKALMLYHNWQIMTLNDE